MINRNGLQELCRQAIAPKDCQRVERALVKYMDLLDQWSDKINLISLDDKKRFVEKHLVPAVGTFRLVKALAHRRILDFGSGGGLPGIPLKIMLPEIDIVLLDSRRRRANFLRQVKRALALASTEIAHTRLEDWRGQKVDLAVTRAAASPRELGRLLGPFVHAHGQIITTLNSQHGQPIPTICRWDGTPVVAAIGQGC